MSTVNFIVFIVLGVCWAAIVVEIVMAFVPRRNLNRHNRDKVYKRVWVWAGLPAYAAFVCWITMQYTGVVPVVLGLV